MWFDGIDDSIKIGSSPSLCIDGSLTMTMWLNVQRVMTAWAMLLSKDTWATSNYQVILDTEHDINFGIGDGSSTYTVRTHVSLLNKGWTLVTCRYDKDAGVMDIWYNDEKKVEKNVGSITPNVNDYPLIIGGQGSRWYHGMIKDVRIYRRALSDDEIRKLYNGEDVRDGLVLRLPMVRGWSSKVIDYSGSENHGTIYGARWGVKKQRGLFTHNKWGSTVVVPYSDTLNITDKLSVFIWAKKTEKEERSGLISTKHSYKDEGQFDMLAGWRTVYSYVALLFEDGSKATFRNADWETMRWTMIGFTFNSETGIVRTITNGEVYAEYSGYNKKLHPMESDLHIGSRKFDPFTGWICNAFVYNRDLTEEEIWRLYLNPDDPPARENLVLWLPLSEGKGTIAFDRSGCGNHGRIVNARWV